VSFSAFSDQLLFRLSGERIDSERRHRSARIVGRNKRSASDKVGTQVLERTTIGRKTDERTQPEERRDERLRQPAG